MWVYRTAFGTFVIKPNGGRFGLYINDECLGSYHSPMAAADDVFCCATGYWEWDRQLMVDAPTDLTEWTKVR